jgi:hypothetical protein
MVGIGAPVKKGRHTRGAGPPETAGIQVGSVLGMDGAIGAGYCVMKETGGRKVASDQWGKDSGQGPVISDQRGEIKKYSLGEKMSTRRHFN